MSQPNSFPLNSDESLVDRAKRLFVEFGHTPLIIAGAIVGLVLVVFFVWSQQAWMADAKMAERRTLETQVEQLRRGYRSELDDLYSAVGDYAIWTETAEMIRGKRPQYWGDALDASSLSRLNVSEFLILGIDLKARLSIAVEGDTEKRVSADPRFIATILSATKKGGLSKPDDSIRGITSLARGQFMFVVRPVFENSAIGGPVGYAAFLRLLSTQAANRVAKYSSWQIAGFTSSQFAAANLPKEAAELASGIGDPQRDSVVLQDETSTAFGYLRLTDIANKPVWLLRVAIPRAAYLRAADTARSQRLMLAGMCLVFSFIGALWVYRWKRLKSVSLAMEQRYRAIIEQADEGVLIVDSASKKIIEGNRAIQRLTALAPDVLTKHTLEELLQTPAGSDSTVLLQLLEGTGARSVELDLVVADASLRPVEVTCSDIEMAEDRLLALVIRDQSVRKKAEMQLLAKQKHFDRLAHHDQLTGLPNRLFLQAHLPGAIERASAEKRLLAVLFLDLDRFKHINDSQGHEVGDKLLQEIAKRVRSAVRPDDVVVRMGGDEFVVVLHGAKTQDEVNGAAGRINTVMAAPLVIDGRAIATTVSIGVSVFPRDGATMGELLKHADTAMYQAKDSGRNNFQVFSPRMDKQIKERVAIETSLRTAIKLNQFEVHYQPIIDISSRKLSGMEALIRWNHPTQGYIPPIRFIEIAEETGLILPIGHFVLNTVARDLAKWRQQGLKVVPIAINISAVQLERTNLRDLIHRTLVQHQLDPDLLQLELTEGSLFEKRTGEFREDALEQLRELGVKIAIDDFGTGYSSLLYLKRWRVDTLKIDRGFISDIVTDPSDFAIVSAIIAMARNLNIQVVAEGIEGYQQLEMLRVMGCHLAQGFLFAKPAPAADAERFLHAQTVDPSQEKWAETTLAETGT
ncbi:MAG: EAL domain-containing protein [Pseudomonadales bacterium]|nr:EAL domain-containing protein [Pseudomonadales bacterium]